MKLISSDKWANFNRDGLLYFSQRVDEMLYHYSNHIYTVPLLNTKLLIREYLNISSLVKDGIIHETNLKHVMEELLHSLDTDIVVKEYVDEDLLREIRNLLNTSNKENIDNVMTYLLGVFSNYNEWCKDYLINIVPQEKEKKKIEKVTRLYISGLIGAGYSHEYIYHFNKKIFQDSPVLSIESLEEFVERFDYKTQTYDVYVACLKQAEPYYDVLESRLNIKHVNDTSKIGLNYNPEKYNVVHLNVEAIDENNAAHMALEILNVFFKFYDLLTDNNLEWFLNRCKVVASNGVEAVVKLEQNRFKYITSHSYGEMTEEIISGLLSNAPSTIATIEKAVTIHNMALSEKNLNNGFMNLWSVLEIIFVSEHGDSKIKELENKILPILIKDYIHSCFEELKQCIFENADGEKLSSVFQDIDIKEDPFWFQKLIILDENIEKRKELNVILKDYPLLRTRINNCNDIFSKKEHFSKELERFSQRIKWHLRRLYRTRNELIHSGEKVKNLKELGEHLHSYVDACLLEIVFRLANDYNINSIDNVVIDTQVKSELLHKRLNKKGKVTKEDIEYIFLL